MKGTKNNIWKVFAINLGKSILGICILIAVGFGSYKISYHFLSKNATNVNTDKDSIKEIIKEAKTEDISKNLIYVCNEKDQITPELAREILAKEKDFYEELTNVEKGKQGKGE